MAAYLLPVCIDCIVLQMVEHMLVVFYFLPLNPQVKIQSFDF